MPNNDRRRAVSPGSKVRECSCVGSRAPGANTRRDTGMACAHSSCGTFQELTATIWGTKAGKALAPNSSRTWNKLTRLVAWSIETDSTTKKYSRLAISQPHTGQPAWPGSSPELGRNRTGYGDLLR